MKINIKKLRDDAILPAYQTSGSSAMDICAAISHPLTIKPLERVLVPSGVAIELPSGYEAQIRARSGLSLKHGIALANGIGTIDSDYRGEIGVILVNLSNENFVVEPGMRIAQMAIIKFDCAEWNVVEQLNETARGEGGFGSTKLV